MARSNERDSHSKCAISQARRASLRVRHEPARSLPFSFSFSAVCFSRRAARTVFTLPSRWDFFFNFASWFSFVLLPVEAIYYFNTVPTTSIDYVEKKGVLISVISFFSFLSLFLSFSLSLTHTHSLARSCALPRLNNFCCLNLSNDATSSVFYLLLRNPVHVGTRSSKR